MRIVKNMDAKSGYHLLITRTRKSKASRKLLWDSEAPVLLQSWPDSNKTSLRKKHVRKLLQPLCYCCTKNNEAYGKVWVLKAIANLSDSRILITILQNTTLNLHKANIPSYRKPEDFQVVMLYYNHSGAAYSKKQELSITPPHRCLLKRHTKLKNNKKSIYTLCWSTSP